MRSGGGGAGGALYREGDSQVKGAARPIRWLQLITVCLLIVRRPQAELLRREGGEFDLITAHPQGDLVNVEGGGREKKMARRTPAGRAVAIFSSSFHQETVPPSVPRSPLTTSHLHNPPDGTRYTVQGKRHGCVLCVHHTRESETIHQNKGAGQNSRGRENFKSGCTVWVCLCIQRETSARGDPTLFTLTLVKTL